MERPRIAVTGVGVVCSVAKNLPEFVQALRAGTLGIGPVEYLDTRWTECKIGGEIKDFALAVDVDLGADLSRADALAITAAAEALGHSGLDAATRPQFRIGTSMGTCQNAPSAIEELTDDEADEQGLARLAGSVADVVARAFDLRGPRSVTSNACAAGGSAITLARDALELGDVDIMVTGGTDSLQFFTYAGFSALHSLDLTPCSPYGRSSGLSLGEGAAIIVLETFEHALARGATIIAELAGCGGSADGYHPTAPDPTGRGAALALQRALRDANIDPDAVDYVNGHGTGTPANDAMERVAFRTVFGDRAHTLPVSSTKSMIGHTLGAAGAIEAVACIVAIANSLLPPTLGDITDPDFDFVATPGRETSVHVAASNNYAFGGSNASLVFASAERSTNARRQSSRDVVLTGVGTVGALGEGIESWIDAFRDGRSGLSPYTFENVENEEDWRALAAEVPPLQPKRYASKADWRKMNEFARMCVAATRLAWNDAALKPTRHELDDVALSFATAGGALTEMVEFHNMAMEGADASPNVFPHSAVNAPAGHVCTVLGIHGPMLSISYGGASGLLAFEHATGLVRRGECDIAILLAADQLSGAAIRVLRHTPWAVLASDAVRPFDVRADGTALGAAAVALVIEAEEHAAARGARPWARVLGTACVGAQPGTGEDEVDGRGWSDAMDRALARAGIAASDVAYCAAAASGIPGPDASELAALSETFGSKLAVGAPKSMTGECLGATAGINAACAALALRDGLLTPTVGLESPRDGFDVRHVVGRAECEPVDYAIANAAVPGAIYGSIVLGRAG